MARPDSHIDRLNSNRGPRSQRLFAPSRYQDVTDGSAKHFTEFHVRDVGECITGHHESDDHRSKGARHTNPVLQRQVLIGQGRAKKRFDVVVLGLVAFVVVESFEGRAISFVKDEQRPVREH